MKIPFYNRWTGAVICEIEIPDDTPERRRVKVALELAVKTGAILTGADLTDANLTDANLTRAKLDGANLSPIREDIYDILRRAVPEVPALLAALREGRVDGSTYTGQCACLCGTIANARGVDISSLAYRDPFRPAERWFLAIRKGDTPATSPIAKITEGWIVDFMAEPGIPA